MKKQLFKKLCAFIIMKGLFNYDFYIICFLSIIVACKKETSCESCANSMNKPPIAIAGPDQVITLPTDSVLLNGKSSNDPDGSISSYSWTIISGPVSFTIFSPAESIAKVKTLVKGVYLFELKVTDNGGLSAKDTIQIIVNDSSPSNHPPIANAGADQTIMLPTNAISIDGSGSYDPDNNIVSYAWTKISGPPSFAIANSNAIQTQVTNLVQGTYKFELKVTDASGLFSKDTVQIIVSAVDIPNVNAGPDIIITLPLDSVYLEASTTVMTPVSFQWTEISGPSVVTITNYVSASNMVLAKGLIAGQYSFRVQVNTTNVIADTMTVMVINDPQDPNTITFKNLKWRLADEETDHLSLLQGLIR